MGPSGAINTKPSPEQGGFSLDPYAATGHAMLSVLMIHLNLTCVQLGGPMQCHQHETLVGGSSALYVVLLFIVKCVSHLNVLCYRQTHLYPSFL